MTGQPVVLSAEEAAMLPEVLADCSRASLAAD
jgi:hypothetical protein